MLVWWFFILEIYDFSIVYRLGRLYCNVDSLLCRFVSYCKWYDCFDCYVENYICEGVLLRNKDFYVEFDIVRVVFLRIFNEFVSLDFDYDDIVNWLYIWFYDELEKM